MDTPERVEGPRKSARAQNRQASAGSKDISRSVYGRLKHKLARGMAALHPAKRLEKEQWLTRDGVAFLHAAGIDKGDTVVDFGCGPGAYSIPAALLVGDNGLVVSVDVRVRVLRRLMRQVAARGLKNVHTAQQLTEITGLLGHRACKAVLLYDMLHFMDSDARGRLYRALREVLGPDGVLSVFPKHLKDDHPSRHFQDMTLEDISREIEQAGFLLTGSTETDLWHNPDRVRGIVLAFRKVTEDSEKGMTNECGCPRSQ